MSIDLEALYIDLHRHPELSFQETRTADVIVRELHALGLEAATGIGRTGVVTAIENGAGPVVWLRADMDGLPVQEQTGLPYASTARGIDPSGTEVPVMHACGHDMHVTALLGALEELLATRDAWSGTVVAVFQPAEEYGAGAQAMVTDGIFDRFPHPDIVLGQHLNPIPAGVMSVRAGTQMAASDGLTVTLYGRGGHGSRPHTTVDPIVMAAAIVMRLQTVVSREVDPREMAVVTVGSIHAGLKNNIIPSEATLELSLRYPDDEARADVLARVERVIRAEALASGAPTEPDIRVDHTLPPTVNDRATTERIVAAFRARFGPDCMTDIGMLPGSEDVSWFARTTEAPLVYWFWGGVDPAQYQAAVDAGAVNQMIPTNHSPAFAPVLHPTIEQGVQNLVVAAREFLA